MNQSTILAIVLAAGKGTRLKTPADQNKVIFPLNNKPMLWYTMQNLSQANINRITVVVGHAAESVKRLLGESVSYATQSEPTGTGTALKAALDSLKSDKSMIRPKVVLSMYGDDSAFYPPGLITSMVEKHEQTNAVITFLTVIKDDPTGCGRIVRDSKGLVKAIVEEKVATPAEKRITEINTGFYCFDYQFISQAVNLIKPNPISKEYYLTDVVEIAISQGQKVETITASDDVWFGVNTKEQLAQADQKMRQKLSL